MFVPRLIERKRDGGALSASEWSALLGDYVAGRVPDYQMAALLMAVVFRGLDQTELGALTDAMLESGGKLDFSGLGRPVVDKHSTGGVGDKVSLVLAPLVASCGVAVPMMSGRGLGHTGGTLDKLEAIPGFRTDLSIAESHAQVERIGCAMFGQTADIAPADRKLYALRDVTGTVESIPLIAASIMSKKLAEGLSGLVLDVKTGSGAFLPKLDDGLELAKTMVRIGEDHGCKTVALVTAMDRPLGFAYGNALETEEAIAALKGEGPADLMEVTYALGVEMLSVAGVARDPAAARRTLEEAISSGRAADKFKAIISAQGGNPAIVDDPAGLPQAPIVEPWLAPASGFVVQIEPRAIGQAIVEMGGGRRTVQDRIDYGVGFLVTVKPGDRVEKGQPVATVAAGGEKGLELGRQTLGRAIRIDGKRAEAGLALVSHRVIPGAVQSVSSG